MEPSGSICVFLTGKGIQTVSLLIVDRMRYPLRQRRIILFEIKSIVFFSYLAQFIPW